MTKKTHKAPSRKRYEERNPVIAFRVTAGEKASIEAEATAVGMNRGEFLRQRQGLSGAEPPPTSGRRVDDDLRRLEIQAILRASLDRITGPEWEGCENIDYHAAVNQVQYLQERVMTMLLRDLEEALPKVLARVARVVGIPALTESIDGLETRKSELEAEVESLETRKAELKTENEEFAASNRAFEENFRDIERKTHMTREDALEWVAKFEKLRRLVPQLSDELSQMHFERQRTHAALAQVRREIERERAFLQQLQGIEKETFAGIVERFGERETRALLHALMDKEKRELEQRFKRVLAGYANSLKGPTSARPPLP